MPVVEGEHPGPDGHAVRYRADYDVVEERTIRLRATFDAGRAPHEAEFDYDRTRVGAAEAVDAFLRNHLVRGL